MIRPVDHDYQNSPFNYKINIFQYYYLPLIGLLKFGLAAAIGYTTMEVVGAPWIGAGMGAIAYTFLSGGIHFDGFVDVVDALYAYGKDRRKIMLEPTIGALGAFWMVTFYLCHLLTLSVILYWCFIQPRSYDQLTLLGCAFLASKVNVFYLLIYNYRRDRIVQDAVMDLFPKYEFYNRVTIDAVSPFVLIYGSLTLALLAAGVPHTWQSLLNLALWGGLLFAAAGFVNLRFIRPIVSELQGMSGDVMGFSIVLVELFSLLGFMFLFVRLGVQ